MDRATSQLVRQRAGQRCEYCRLPQQHSALRFHIEHIVARQHGGTAAVTMRTTSRWPARNAITTKEPTSPESTRIPATLLGCSIRDTTVGTSTSSRKERASSAKRRREGRPRGCSRSTQGIGCAGANCLLEPTRLETAEYAEYAEAGNARAASSACFAYSAVNTLESPSFTRPCIGFEP